MSSQNDSSNAVQSTMLDFGQSIKERRSLRAPLTASAAHCERRSLRAPLGAPLSKVRARARPPLQKEFDERERERRSQNRRVLAMSGARRSGFFKSFITRDLRIFSYKKEIILVQKLNS